MAGALTPQFSGAVLAGGSSRRMGRDKAALLVGAETLLERQLRLLRESGAAECLVSLRAGSPLPPAPRSPGAPRYIVDARSDAGPLAGLEAVLASARHPIVLVLAVDLPALSPGFLAGLVARSTRDRGTIPSRGGELEPLAATYPCAALELVREHLLRGEFALTRLARRCLATGLALEWPLAPAEEHLLTNWNRPEDWNPATRAVKNR